MKLSDVTVSISSDGVNWTPITGRIKTLSVTFNKLPLFQDIERTFGKASRREKRRARKRRNK